MYKDANSKMYQTNSVIVKNMFLEEESWIFVGKIILIEN